MGLKGDSMRKAGAFILIFLMGLPVMLSAQEDSGDPEVEPDWGDYSADLYVRGDQTFTISLGVAFPTVFLNNGSVINHNFSPPVGGTGSLFFSHFLDSTFFVGAELGVIFLPTPTKNTVFIIPLGAKIGAQFIVWRFEFPISLTLGMAWQKYLNSGYYGLYTKVGGSAFYKAFPQWSFGLTLNWSWFPQWTADPAQNIDGNFIELTLSARYHF